MKRTTLARMILFVLFLVCYSAGVLAQSSPEGPVATRLEIPPGSQAVTWPSALVLAAWMLRGMLADLTKSMGEVGRGLSHWQPRLTVRLQRCDDTGEHHVGPQE